MAGICWPRGHVFSLGTAETGTYALTGTSDRSYAATAQPSHSGQPARALHLLSFDLLWFGHTACMYQVAPTLLPGRPWPLPQARNSGAMLSLPHPSYLSGRWRPKACAPTTRCTPWTSPGRAPPLRWPCRAAAPGCPCSTPVATGAGHLAAGLRAGHCRATVRCFGCRRITLECPQRLVGREQQEVLLG